MILPVIIYFIIASFSKKQVGGVRYILPVYGFLYIFAGRLFVYHENIKLTLKIKKIIMWIITLWYAFVSLKIHPHYLAYFNQISGGSENGWRHLIDSNIDWGQDLKELKKYLEKEGNPELMLSYLGRVFPERYGIIYKPFISHIHIDFSIPENFYYINSLYPEKEYLAMSVNNIVVILYREMKKYPEKYKIFKFLEEVKPIKKLGIVFLFTI